VALFVLSCYVLVVIGSCAENVFDAFI
jgi:hypothetical protein